MRNVNGNGQTRLFYVHNGSIFCLSEPIDGERATVANGMTIGIACDGPEQVLELHRVALEHGATSIEQPPGPRESSLGGTVHLCYFRDLDGHKMCGIFRPG